MQKKQQYTGDYQIYGLVKQVGLLFLVFSSSYTFSLVPFADSGRLLRPGKYEFAAHVQFISEKAETQINFMGHIDQGLRQRRDANIRYFLGGGESGLLTGSFLKWIPFPDYKYQPAIGASSGISLNLFNHSSYYISLHLRPLISKELGTVVGKFIPYVALPFSIKIRDLSEVQFPFRVTVGIHGELFFIHFHKIECNVEFSTDITKATSSYFNVGIITRL